MKKIKTYFELEAGTIVTKIENKKLKFLTIYRTNMNDYTLPKGHVEEGESLEDASERETLEETGYFTETKNLVDSFEYKVEEEKDGENVFFIRRVYYFLGFLTGETIEEGGNPDLKEGKTTPSWLTYEEALNKLTYDTDKNLIKKVYSKNGISSGDYLKSIIKDLTKKIKNNHILNNSILKFGLIGSVNDGEFSDNWSDLDFMFVLENDKYGNIDTEALNELRKMSTDLSCKYPEIEISFLTHTYDDFQKYVSFEYLNHYKFAVFFLENDTINFSEYIEKIVENRKINRDIKKRYSVYHLRHFRFNLLRKVVSTPDDKEALKMVIDKLIEVMILLMTYHNKTVRGKRVRLEEIKKLKISKDIKSIFEKALEKRNSWDKVKVNDKEVIKWLKNFEKVINLILKNNLYDVPEEFINKDSSYEDTNNI